MANENWNGFTADSQCAAIARHLEEKGSITQLEALSLYGCMRLASRINDLRSRGLQIETEKTESIGFGGKKKYYATYRLKG